MKKILLSILFAFGIIGFSNIYACETCGCKNKKDAVLEITEDGFKLSERAPGVSVSEIIAATEANLIITGEVPEMII